MYAIVKINSAATFFILTLSYYHHAYFFEKNIIYKNIKVKIVEI